MLNQLYKIYRYLLDKVNSEEREEQTYLLTRTTQNVAVIIKGKIAGVLFYDLI